MKLDRFAWAATRAAAVVLASLLLAASLPAAGQIIRIGVGGKKSGMAVALARQVGEVQKRFKKNRHALRSVPGPDGKPVFPEEAVAGLIASTEKDLDQAIEKVGEPGLDALRAWAAEEFRRIQEDLAPPPGATPRAVAVVASLEGFSLSKLASVNAAAPQQRTISAETSKRLLDWAEEVASRIFVLAKKDDLEVELWVGSTPAPQATFRFWSQGKVKGATPAPTIVQTNGKRKHVLRGLYAYRAALGKGAVAQLIEYPNPAGPSATGMTSEQLDLVKGSRFFCCQFNESYCRHVNTEKECRP